MQSGQVFLLPTETRELIFALFSDNRTVTPTALTSRIMVELGQLQIMQKEQSSDDNPSSTPNG